MKHDDKRVDRRNFFLTASGMSGAVILSADGVLGMGKEQGKGDHKMMRLGDVISPPEKEGREKHVPHIEAPTKVRAGEAFQVVVTVGKETAHPNTIGHHIKWVQIFVKEDGPRPVIHMATFDFAPGYAEPRASFTLMLNESSHIIATGYCNVHGLWDNSVKVEVTQAGA